MSINTNLANFQQFTGKNVRIQRGIRFAREELERRRSLRANEKKSISLRSNNWVTSWFVFPPNKIPILNPPMETLKKFNASEIRYEVKRRNISRREERETDYQD